MKIVQKILSHGMLIAFFVAIFLLYLYRVELFPQWFGAESGSLAQKALPEVEMPPAVKTVPPVSTDVTAPPPAAGAVELPPMAGEASASKAPVATKPEPEAVAAQAALPPEATVEKSATPAPVMPPPAPAPQHEAVPEAPPAQQQMPPAVQKPPQADTQVQTAKAAAQPEYEKQLAAARELFWRHNMRAAVEAYQSLTESHPDRADAWGELGNLYFSMGRWSQAAAAYGQALGLLIDQGELIRARNMLPVMHSLDSGKASELEARLKKASG